MTCVHLATNVRFYRHLQGWSQHELAQQAGVGQKDVSRFEGGYRASDSQITLLAQALNVPIDVLLRRPRVITRMGDARPVVLRQELHA